MKKVFLLLFSITLLFGDANYKKIKSDYLQSYDYERMGKYSEAIKVLAPLYEKYPKGYTLNLRYGWLFYLDKKYNDAKEYYYKASLLKPYALAPRLGLMRVYIATNSYADAEKVGNRLLQTDFYNYYANIYIIQAFIAQKKYDIAQKVVSKMLSLYPTDISFLELLGVIYQKTDSPYLEKLYEDILVLDPNNIFVKSQVK